MADENLVERPAVSEDPIDSFTEGVGLPEQPKEVEGPATEENQKATEKVMDFTQKVKKEQERMKRLTGNKPTFTESQHAVVMKQKQKSEQQEAQQQKLEQQAQQEAEQDRDWET